MAMPARPQPITTIEELWALPDDGLRHELLDGVHVVTPAPAYRHQRVLSRLFEQLLAARRAIPDMEVLSSPADIRLNTRTLVQPDLFAFRHPAGRPARGWDDIGIPLLAVEILSPSTASRDRVTKRRIYQRAGVAEYWVVDIDARLIERWRTTDDRPEIVTDKLEWRPLMDHDPIPIDLPTLFAGLADDV